MKFEEVTIDRNRLTQQEIELVQRTWLLVGDSVEMAIDFYNRMFHMYPAIRPMFKENIRLQARKFTDQITLLINKTNNWCEFESDIRELGRRHTAYQVKEQHYACVRDALFFSLKNHLKNDWNEQVEQAWAKFYTIITDLMMVAQSFKG